MYYLKKLLALTALAVTAMALFAISASADTVVINTATGLTPDQGTYNGPTSGTEVGTPTITSGNSTYSCDSADFVGTIDGTAGTAQLSFSWATNTSGGTPGTCSVDTPTIDPVTCDIDPIGTDPRAPTPTATSVSFTAAAVGSGPNGRLLQAENAGTTILCGTVFDCNITSTVTTSTATGTSASASTGTVGVTGEYNAAADTLTFAEVVQFTGLWGCSNPATWNAVYGLPTNLAVRP